MENNIRQELVDLYDDEELLFADGFDDAIIGVCNGFNRSYVVAYDMGKIIDSLVNQGMSTEEAQEYFDYNIIGAYVGEKTPIYINVYNK